MELRRIPDALVRFAKESGARSAEALVVQSDVRRLSAESRPGGHLVTEDQVWVRVYDEQGRCGRATGSLGSEEGRAVIKKAIAKMPAAPPDPGGQPPPRLDATVTGLSILDRRWKILEDTDRREIIAENHAGCRSVPSPLASLRFQYEERLQRRCFSSSRGVDLFEESTFYQLHGEASAAERPDLRVTGSVLSRHFADVASMPMGADLGARITAMSRKALLPPERRAVVLEPRAVASLFMALIEAFRSERVATGKSFLSGHLGDLVASERVHVVDDGTITGGYATRGFDDRGVPPVPLPLIREGVSAGLYQGPHAAWEANRRPSGHERADGSLWSGNLIIRPGSRSRNMLFPELGSFAAIDEVMDTAGINPATGKIEVPVRVSRWEGAECAGYVGIRTLSTDAISLLKSVQHVTSDQTRFSGIDVCTLICDGPWLAD